MNVRIVLNASYPRTEYVAKLYSRFLSGKIPGDEFEKGIEEATINLFKFLKEIGINIFTDGMFRWDDIFNPLIKYVEGVKINGLIRFYDNNFFFRAPIIESKLKLSNEHPFKEWFKKSLDLAKNVFGGSEILLKQPLPGPLTLALNSINNHYGGLDTLISDWRSEVLEPLIKDLSTVGLSAVEIHEPSLVWKGTSDELRKVGVKELSYLIDYASSIGVDVWLLTYFGSLRKLRELVNEVSRAIIGLDYYSDERGRVQLVIRDYGLKRVMLGVLNARNTLMERPENIRRAIFKALDYGAKEIYVGNNAPLDFIPEVIASKKLRRLSRIVRKLRR